METRDVMVTIPKDAAIVVIKCYDGAGSFFAESMSIIAEEEKKEENKEEETKEEIQSLGDEVV